MAKVSYANLKIKVSTEVNTFEFNGQTIEVLKYLPLEDKYDLVMITLQNSLEDGIYNELKLDMFFHLYIVYLYTNLSFTDKQRENETKIYDCLKSSGFIDKVIATMEEDEYNILYHTMERIVEDTLNYKNTAAAVIQSLISDLPANADAAARIVDAFDPDQYQAVVDFAQAANGGRPISGPYKNQEV